MTDLKDLLEPLSRVEMPDRWDDVQARLPRRLLPEPRRPKLGALAVAVVSIALVVGIGLYLIPLRPEPRIGGAGGRAPRWLVERAYASAYAAGDMTPDSARWVLSDADTIAPAVGLDHGDANVRRYLVVMTGDFTAYDASVPSGAALPTGHVLALALDTSTHEVTDLGVSDREIHVPGLSSFELPPRFAVASDDEAGWTATVPPGWRTATFATGSGASAASGVLIENRDDITMPTRWPTGILPQASSTGFPSDGLALVIAPMGGPIPNLSPIETLPVTMEDFLVGSASGDATSELDTMYVGLGEATLGITLRLGFQVSPVDRAAIADVVASLSPLEGAATGATGVTSSPAVSRPTPTPSEAASPTPPAGDVTRLPGTGTLAIASGTQLSAISAGESTLHELTTSARFDGCCGISVSPDGTSVAYGVPKSSGASVVEIASLETGAVIGTSPSSGTRITAKDATWAPDGTAVLYSDGRNLDVYSLHGNVVSTITHEPSGCVDSVPAWSAASAAIAYYHECAGTADAGIYMKTSTAARPVRIHGPLGSHGAPTGLTWSPDGTELAAETADGAVWLVSAKAASPHASIVVAGASGHVVEGSGTVAWSPDGRTIAFVANGEVRLVSLATSRVSRLAATAGGGATSIWWGS